MPAEGGMAKPFVTPRSYGSRCLNFALSYGLNSRPLTELDAHRRVRQIRGAPSNKELLLQGKRRGLVTDLLGWVASARRGSLLYRLYLL